MALEKAVGQEGVMKLLYPRCCVLALQDQTVLAHIRIQDTDSPAHNELRSFSRLPADWATLSNWLADHGITHVVVEGTSRAWHAVYPKLQQDFTVLVIEAGRLTDVKNIGRIASLFAYGLEPCRLMPPTVLQEPSSRRSRKLVILGTLTLVGLLASFAVWRFPSRMDLESLAARQPATVVRWRQTSVTQQYPSGMEFTFPLPELEISPQGMPVQVTLDETGDRPRWIDLDRERLSIRGTAPPTDTDQTYQFSVRASAAQGSDSRLLIVLTITGQADPVPPTAPLRGHWAW